MVKKRVLPTKIDASVRPLASISFRLASTIGNTQDCKRDWRIVPPPGVEANPYVQFIRRPDHQRSLPLLAEKPVGGALPPGPG
jgi:hypothetical protein